MMGERSGHSADGDAALLLGGADDFGRLYLRHEDHVLAFFRRRTGSAELAADLTAETFARALRDRPRFDPSQGDVAAWLFGIARHLLADSLRHGRVQDNARRRLGLERLLVDDQALARIDELGADLALAALGELPADQRAAVEARVLGEESYDELAVRLRCSRSVARQRVSRGLRALRERLEASS
jgi:RNA polymerase sigma-70 factor (ECF subfamily)